MIISTILTHFVASASTYCPAGGGDSCTTGLPMIQANKSNLASLLEIVFAILGVLTILLVMIGGFRLIIAQGDPQAVAKARNTILYAIVGLAIAICSEAIVAFTLGKL